MPARFGLIAVPTTTPKPRAKAARRLAISGAMGNRQTLPVGAPAAAVAGALVGNAYGMASGGPTRWPHSTQ
jgi:hypothetical protein